MPAPTLVASYRTANYDTSGVVARNVTGVAWNSGDLILVKANAEDFNQSMTAPTNANLTFAALAGFPSTPSSKTHEFCWQATAGSTQTAQTIAGANSLAISDGGYVVEVWRNHSGVGAIRSPVFPANSTNPTSTIVTTQANSALSCMLGDWSASAASTPTTGPGAATTEYAAQFSGYSVCSWYHADVGATGTKTFGVTNAATIEPALWAIEIKGIAAAQPIATKFLTGFEHGFVGTAATAGLGLFDTVTAGCTASTSAPRNGAYCLHVVAPANTAARVTKAIISQTKLVTRFGVKVTARPSTGTVKLMHSQGFTVSISSAGVLSAQLATTGAAQTGPTIDTTSWHWIELQGDTAAGTLDWKVDGVPQTRATGTGSAVTIVGLGTDLATQPAFTADYDDWIIGQWANAATDWYGDGKVLAQLAGLDGTHSSITSLSPGDAGTVYSGTVTTAYTMVDDPPGTGGWTATRSTTDNLALRIAAPSNSYAEIKPAAAPYIGAPVTTGATGVSTAANLVAQSFKATSGTITSVKMALYQSASPVGTFDVRIVNDDGGVPGSTVLASTSIAASSLPTTAPPSTPLTDVGLTVAGLTPGATYWLHLSVPGPTSPGTVFWSNSGNLYPDGGSIVQTLIPRVADQGFEVSFAGDPGPANAVRALMSYSSPATQANLAGCTASSSDTAAAIPLHGFAGGSGAAYNVTANNFKGGIIPMPPAGWTVAEVNAVRFRFGSCVSADISPVPTVQALMWEVDWPVATGPQAYPRTASDTIALSDSVTERELEFRRPADDINPLSDAAVGRKGVSRGASDLVVVIDSGVEVTRTQARPADDVNPVSDSATRVPSTRIRPIADTISISDTAVRATTTRIRTATDSWTIADVAVRGPGARPRLAVDSVALSDVATRATATRIRTAADAVVITDSAAGVFSPGVANLVRTATDSWSISDTATQLSTRTRPAVDAVVLSDAAVRAPATRTRPVVDSISTSDTASRAAATRISSAADAVAISDLAIRAASARARTAADSWTAADVAIPTSARVRTATDSWSCSDTATRTVKRIITATDTVAFSDIAIGTKVIVRGATDAFSITDIATQAAAARTRTAADSWTGSDTAARTPAPRVRPASDAVAVSDIATRAAAARTSAAVDSWSASDTAAGVKVGGTLTTAIDSFTVNDVAARAAAARVRVAADSVATSDTATRISTRARTAVDSWTRSDTAIGAKVSLRGAVDTVVMADIAVRIAATKARIAADSVTITDSVARIAAHPGRTAVDNWTRSDTATVRKGYIRPTIDVITVSDTAIRGIFVRQRQVFDSITASDTAQRGTFTRQRTTIDIILLSDMALRSTIGRIRTAVDAVAFSDVAGAVMRTGSAPQMTMML